jgi:endogenous inhibitor of DNA gyrase (YacG/DUF329 family)
VIASSGLPDVCRVVRPVDARVGPRDSHVAMKPPDRPVPLRAVRIQAQCPVCRKAADEKYKPFCSKRCADIDLGRWLKESYRVPTDEPPSDGDEPPPGPTGQER